MEKKDWEDSEFEKKVRISLEDLEFIKKIKKKKSIAGKLKEIINHYRKDTTQKPGTKL